MLFRSPGPCLIVPDATATAELIFDLAGVAGWPLTPESAQALYVGLLTDTGGFRFSNTTARALRVAAALLEKGVDPEEVYAAVYASAPEGRVRLLAEVLQTLVVEPDAGLAWVSVPADALRRHDVTPDDLDGVVEFPRSIAGVRLALLFRHIGNGRIKVSFRSMGEVDVAELAHQFGGGGHHRAAGASLAGSMAEVEEQVLTAARRFLKNGQPARARRISNHASSTHSANSPSTGYNFEFTIDPTDYGFPATATYSVLRTKFGNDGYRFPNVDYGTWSGTHTFSSYMGPLRFEAFLIDFQ